MGNREDWKEIEQSIEQSDNEKAKKYRGLNIIEMLDRVIQRATTQTIDGWKALKIILKIMVVAVVIWVVFQFYVFLKITISNLQNSHEINVESNIETSQYAKVALTSQDTDEEENGKYYFQLEKFPQIQFTSIKFFGSEYNDLEDNLHQYIFRQWEDPDKKKFHIIQSKTKDDLLIYETYLKIDTYEELLEGTEVIIRYLQYAEEWNKENGKIIDIWQQKEGQFIMPLQAKIYLKKGENKLLLYHERFQTADEIRQEAKLLYQQFQNETEKQG